MRDVLRLRRAIHRALFLAPLAVPGIATLGACAKDDPAKIASVNVPATGSVSPLSSTPSPSVAEAGDDTAGLMPEGGPPIPHARFPRCPSGAFCATKAKMATFADKGSPKKLDCPTQLEERDRPDGAEGMPRMRYARMSFDEQGTTATRSDGGASDSCCYTWLMPCPGGRPLLSEDRPVVAEALEGAAWSAAGVFMQIPELAAISALSDEARRDAADAWQRDALSEHASIASFARATLELLSVGAPLELVKDTQRAGMDEVRHASACFDVARALGCTATTPGPLPPCAPRAPDLVRLARDTFIEGCVGETVSALAATRASDRATGAVRSVWRLLAADETRHAALAWRTLAWALRASGPAVARELLAFAEGMRDELLRAASVQAAASNADTVVFGRLSQGALAAVHRDAWLELIMPALIELVGSEAPQAS